MRLLHTAIATLASLITASAWAMQNPCPGGVCVGYTVDQAVPLSPEAMGLLALMVGVVAYATLRGKLGRVAGIALAAGLAVLASVYDIADSYANGFMIHFTSGNPAKYTFNVEEMFPLVVTVQNNLGQQAAITSIQVDAACTWDTTGVAPYTPCGIGQNLASNGVCALRVDCNVD